MSNSVLILGGSGTGKSTSLRNLDSKTTFIVNVINKPLPFKGAKSKYQQLSSDGMTGNYYCTDLTESLMRVINLVNNKRTDVKTLVIDDFGYTVTNNFMRRCHQKGYDKFIEIAKNMFDVLNLISNLRDDLFCFTMMHNEIDLNGISKPRTVGKMTDQYVCIEGKYSTVLHTVVTESQYGFITNFDGIHTAKSPMGMFDEFIIDNDLQLVREKMVQYFEEE